MLKYILLGALQGLTEFFPVSSSGHLVLAERYLGVTQNALFLLTWLHLGTLLALVTFFFKDILTCLRDRRLRTGILVATLATGLIGLSLMRFFETLFTSPAAVGIALLMTGLALWATRYAKPKNEDMTLKDAGLMGIAQGLAIAPGLSRSGVTIATLLGRGLSEEKAFRFSFVASIPAIFGAFLWELKKAGPTPAFPPFALGAGLLAAYVTGLAALQGLQRIVLRGKLHLFAFYCAGLGTAVLLMTLRPHP